LDRGADNLETLESMAGEALDDLRRQHAMLEAMAETPLRTSVLRLLSHSLRLSQWLQRERNRLRGSAPGSSD
jgi:hypothetical protein